MALNPGILGKQKHPFPPAPPRAVVMVTGELLLDLIHRANPDKMLTIEWGEPTSVPDYMVVYEPTCTEHWADEP